MNVILHSTGCPKCKVLKLKLDKKNIAYTENHDIDIEDMKNRGFMSMPILQVDDEYMDFSNANNWINQQ